MNEQKKDAYRMQIYEFSEKNLKILLDESQAWIDSRIKVFEEYLELLRRHGKFSTFLSDTNVLKNPQRISMRTLQSYWDAMCMLTFGSKQVPTMADDRIKKSLKAVVVPSSTNDGAIQFDFDQQAALSDEISKHGESMPVHFSEWKHLMSPSLMQMTNNCQMNLAMRAKERDTAILLAESKTADTELIKAHIKMADHYHNMLIDMDRLARQEWEALQRGEYPMQTEQETEAALQYISLKEKFEYVDPTDAQQEIDAQNGENSNEEQTPDQAPEKKHRKPRSAKK